MPRDANPSVNPAPRPALSWSRRLLATAVVLLMAAGSVPAAAPPDFNLKDLSGDWFRLGDHLGKEVIYISFWATWCTPCRRELPELQKMFDELGAQGLLVVAVNTDPSSAHSQVRSWVKQRKFSFPFVLDPDNNVLDKYNPARNLPFGMLIDRQGHIVETYAGYRAGEEAMLRDKVAGLLAQSGGDASASTSEGHADRSAAAP